MSCNNLIDRLLLEGWNREKEIGLIAAPCGTGKTYASINELARLLDIESQNVLLLFPRTAIKEQTLNAYDCEEFNIEENAFGNKRSKVQVATCQAIGRAFRNKMRIQNIKLVIVDEWHTLFAENHFAVDLLYFQEAMKEWVDDSSFTVVALTGTPTLPLKFVNSAPFEGLEYIYDNKIPHIPVRSICDSIEPVFKADEVLVEQNKSLEVCLRSLPASNEWKQIVFVKGKIERLISLAANDENATWLCSKSTKSKIGGKFASYLMNQEHYQEILSGRMPQGINRIYLSSAYREGLNLEDPSIKEVIVEGVNDIDIIQSFGRVRHDTKRLVIVIDNRKYAGVNNKTKAARELLEDGNPQAFADYYDVQEKQAGEDFEGDRKPILVYEDKKNGELLFNYYVLCYWLYSEWSLHCASRYEMTWLGQKLPNCGEYFESFLERYSKSAIKYNVLDYIRPATIEQENEERLNMFDWACWLEKEIYGDAVKEFSASLGLKNKDYSTMAISGIFKKYEYLFASKRRLKRDGRKQIVYILKKDVFHSSNLI